MNLQGEAMRGRPFDCGSSPTDGILSVLPMQSVRPDCRIGWDADNPISETDGPAYSCFRLTRTRLGDSMIRLEKPISR